MEQRFEVLKGLPPYGPLPKVIPQHEHFYSEGFVVRFYKNDGSFWVANFLTGWDGPSAVYGTDNPTRFVILAQGAGYVIDIEKEREIATISSDVKHCIKSDSGQIILVTDFDVTIVERDDMWNTRRISIDGIDELAINGSMLSGMCFYPVYEGEEWIPFSLDLVTRKVTGGSI